MRDRRTLLVLFAVVVGLLMPAAGTAAAVTTDPSPKPAPLARNLASRPATSGMATPRALPGASTVTGPFQIVAIWSRNYDMCLDGDANNPNNGARVQLWACNGTSQQLWYFHHLDRQNHLVQNARNGKLLDAHLPCVGSNGCHVQLWQHVPGNANQVWWLWNDPQTGWERYQNAATSNMQLDADLNAGINRNGTKVQLWQYIQGQVNQMWGIR